ncbi:MAG TPA: fatty acyl-AMP ligase [Ktedonobacteraceae bacterium]|nr:fatty acyl-AMP ligase [Ktedonobacteraceae bacterium]
MGYSTDFDVSGGLRKSDIEQSTKIEEFHLPSTVTTLIELVRYRANQQKDQTAFIFLLDGETQEVRLSFADLDQHARVVASALQKITQKGDRVLLLYPAGLDFIIAFFGCLYAGVIAIPMYPPQSLRADQSLPRIQAIANDAQAVVALTTRSMLDKTRLLFEQAPDFRTLRWITTDTLSYELATGWREPIVDNNTPAFLQYTSGSTGVPKGVILTHGNLIHNQQIMQTAFNLNGQSTFVSWLPLYHDMGLIAHVLQPLYLGTFVVLMSPVHFLQRPIRWLSAISRYKATTSSGPNFAFDLCVRKITEEQRATLDLSSWRTAVNGSEPVRYETLERFVEYFAPCGFRREVFAPSYGLAEATLMVTGGHNPSGFQSCRVSEAELACDHVVTYPRAEEATRTLVGCGRPWLGQQVFIVDPESRVQCVANQIGEIWVAGPSVSHGYWHRTKETKQSFQAYLADTGKGPFLRTGDLGFLLDDELYITGRLKDLIIIRGRNIYPQDIELTVAQCHDAFALDRGAAFSIEVEGEEQLVVVQEVDRHYMRFDLNELKEVVRQALGEHNNVQPYEIVFIKHGTLPKTSSGKIQRHLARKRYLDAALQVVGGLHE